MKISNDINFGAIPQGIRIVNNKILAGGKLTWKELQALKDENVGQIIDLRCSSTLYPQLKEFICCKFLGIKRENIPVVLFKSLPDKDTFEYVKKTVDKCPQKTFIHCNSGLHRTNLFCEALQILNGEKTVKEAIDSLINNGFFKLRNIEKREPEIVKIQLETLHKRLNDFKEMFSK